MSGEIDLSIRRAEAADAETVGRLLHDFNTEFDDYTPGASALAENIRKLLDEGHIRVLLGGGAQALGLALLRFRPSIWTDSLDCYLEELYVVPDHRGMGLGRALVEAAMDLARREGAAHMDLGTAAPDVAARGLYESLGFSNREGKPGGPLNYFYERER